MGKKERMEEIEEKEEIIVKKKGGFLGKFLAVLLGFLIGIIAGIGGLVGGGYLVLSKVTIKKGFDYINKFAGTDIDYTQYINGNYAEHTVLDMVGVVAEAVSKVSDGTGTLNTLNDISPYVSKLVVGDGEEDNGLVGKLTDYGIQVDNQELMDRIISKPKDMGDEKDPDTYLTDYLLDCINSMYVHDAFDALGYETNDLFLRLCCGVEGEDFERDGNGKIQMIGDAKALTLGEFVEADLMTRLETLPLAFIINPKTEDAIMCAISYGAHTRYEVVDGEVEMKQVYYTIDAENKIFDDKNKELTPSSLTVAGDRLSAVLVLDLGEEETETQYLKSEDGTIFYAYSDEAMEKEIEFPEITIGDLKNNGSDILDDITLSDAMHVTPGQNKILDALVKDNEGNDRTLGDLQENGSNMINDIQLADILTAELDDSLMMYLLYGKKNIHYQLVEDPENPGTFSVKMMPQRVAIYGTKVYNAYGDTVLATDYNVDGGHFSQNGVLYKAVANDTLGTIEITENEDTFTAVYYDVYTEDGTTQLYFKPNTLGDLTGENNQLIGKIMDRLSLGEVLGEDNVKTNKILSRLADTPISKMSGAVNQLKIVEIFETDVYYYEDGKGFTDKDGNALPDQTDTDSYVMRPTWTYLLMDGEGHVDEHLTVNEGVGTMMNNMTRNIQTATMGKLIADGILTVTGDAADLYEMDPNAAIFQMTINEMINALFSHMHA